MGAIKFYSKAVKLAFTHSLDHTQYVLFVLFLILGIGSYFVPKLAKWETVVSGWEAAALILGGIFLVRLLLAPYWLNLEQEATITALKSERSEECKDALQIEAVLQDQYVTHSKEMEGLLQLTNTSSAAIDCTEITYSVTPNDGDVIQATCNPVRIRPGKMLQHRIMLGEKPMTIKTGVIKYDVKVKYGSADRAATRLAETQIDVSYTLSEGLFIGSAWAMRIADKETALQP